MRNSMTLLCLIVLSGLLSAGCGLRADIARLKGYEALQAGNIPEAKSKFELAAAHEATDWKSHYYLGRIGLDHTNDAYYARRHLEIAETIRKSMPEAKLAPVPGAAETAVPWPTRHEIADALAESMLRQNLRERLYSYTRQQTTDYGEARDYLRVGRYLAALGDHDGARVAYRTATLIADPLDAEPHLMMADFLDSVNDPESALLELRKAYYIDPMIKGLADNIRRHGVVPGPTIALKPEREQVEIIRRGKEAVRDIVYEQPTPTSQP